MPAHRWSQRLLCNFAMIGQVFLLASAWLLPFASEFRLVGDDISELVLGRNGGVMTLAFLVSGLGTIGLAFALHRATRALRGSAWASMFVALNGLGLFVAGLAPTDRIDSPSDVLTLSPTGWVHVAAAFVGLVSAVAAMLVAARVFSRSNDWRWLVPWSVLLGGASLALLFAQNQGPLVGLMQRALVTLVSAWMVVVAVNARTLVRGEPSRPVGSTRK